MTNIPRERCFWRRGAFCTQVPPPAALLVALLLLLAWPARAQFLDPDRAWTCWPCYDHNWHFVAGVGLDFSARLPLFNPTLRRHALGRVAVAASVGAGYELLDYATCRYRHDCGQPDRGFGLVDLSYDIAGALVSEGVQALVRHWFRRR